MIKEQKVFYGNGRFLTKADIYHAVKIAVRDKCTILIRNKGFDDITVSESTNPKELVDYMQKKYDVELDGGIGEYLEL